MFAQNQHNFYNHWGYAGFGTYSSEYPAASSPSFYNNYNASSATYQPPTPPHQVEDLAFGNNSK